MTEKQKKAITLAVLLTLLGAFSLPLAKAAWSSKLDTSTFELHVQEEKAHNQLDSARAKEQKDLLLDVLCGVKAADRRCRGGNP